MKVWITGASGMLAHDVRSSLDRAGHEIIGTDLEVDIADSQSVEQHLDQNRDVEWIINCAAWTNVDKAEDHEADAFRVNAEGPGVLARAAAERDAKLLHVSTDYVFDGTKNGPYRPEDAPNPQSAYGRTKRAGEQKIAESGCFSTVVRTAWLYGAHGGNFVATMLRLMNEREGLRVVNDQYGCPTYTRDLADLTAAVVAAPQAGTFHFTGSGRTTWFEFAKEIQAQAMGGGLLSKACAIVPVSSGEYAAKAPRPANSELDCSRTTAAFGVSPAEWREALSRYLKEVS